MKNRTIYYLGLFSYLVALAIYILGLSGCKNKTEDPDPLEVQLEKLMNGTSDWALGSVVKDGYDVTSDFEGFTLKVGRYTYTTKNSLPTAWPSSGTWQFVDDDPTKVLRDESTMVDVNLTDTQLILTFSVSGLNTGGRAAGIDGQYVFTLVSN